MVTADPFGMNRFTLRFSGADMEVAFAEEQARKAVRPLRLALIFLSALMVGHYVLTIHVFKGVMVGLGAAGMVLSTIGAVITYAIFYALTYRPVFLRRQQLILVLLASLISFGVTRQAARLPLEVLEARGFAIMLTYIFLIYSVLRLRFPQAALAGWLGAGYFVGYLFALELMDPIAAARAALFLGLANFGGMLICYQMEVSARREFAAMRMLDGE